VAQKLMDKGFTKAYALKGGWNEWLKANYPTEKKCPFPGYQKSINMKILANLTAGFCLLRIAEVTLHEKNRFNLDVSGFFSDATLLSGFFARSSIQKFLI
jgi:hypothetical protein